LASRFCPRQQQSFLQKVYLVVNDPLFQDKLGRSCQGSGKNARDTKTISFLSHHRRKNRAMVRTPEYCAYHKGNFENSWPPSAFITCSLDSRGTRLPDLRKSCSYQTAPCLLTFLQRTHRFLIEKLVEMEMLPKKK
jgi:hypothetical protein